MAARPVRQAGSSLFDAEPDADPGADPDAGPGPAPVSDRSLVIEADGGSRGNPGPAAYGALVRDAESGTVLDQEGLTIGVTTNNVAEYSGLIAGLEMARALDPGAALEVRMDSRLVVEQMAGRWKIKHPSMRPLALAARQLLPSRVRWVWVPREQNKAADGLVNSALDGTPVPRAVAAG